ncbi:MAG: tripartite tricarboxylate transporter substrate binding protein [Geminicoccaceae bacterium]
MQSDFRAGEYGPVELSGAGGMSAARRANPEMRRRRFLELSLGLAAGGLAASAARAEDYPARVVTLVVPFTPGGSADFLGRIVGDQIAHGLGQPVVIDNRPGAGGSVGSAVVAKAEPDGYTLLLGHIGTLAFNPSLYPKLPYDPVSSFAPISMAARLPNVLVVNPSVPVQSVSELIDYARAHPGELNYSSGGNGSAAHIAMAAFASAAEIDLVHVPYKGTAPGVTDLIGGRVQLTMTGGPAVLPLARAGKLRALAVSSATRLAAEPELPTIAEAALPGFEASQWYGIVAPAGTPDPIVQRLNAAVRQAMASPEVVTKLASEGADPWLTTPPEFSEIIATDIARWGQLIRDNGIQVQ